ncbi:MAG: hypothetical protein LLG45_12755 [Actinomycetia bacterium]|nr:hypothetical protein [Actinomycetes bacterium]
MTVEPRDLSYSELLALLAGDVDLRLLLTAGERFRVETPFFYPGRHEPVVAYLAPAPQSGRPPIKSVRISDGGGLIEYLADQGMDLEVDMVLSKTVFHAVRQVEGAGIAGGQVYLDSTPDKVGTGLWRFLQLVIEVTGLRHAKYKDALLQLERRQGPDSAKAGWRPT